MSWPGNKKPPSLKSFFLAFLSWHKLEKYRVIQGINSHPFHSYSPRSHGVCGGWFLPLIFGFSLWSKCVWAGVCLCGMGEWRWVTKQIFDDFEGVQKTSIF